MSGDSKCAVCLCSRATRRYASEFAEKNCRRASRTICEASPGVIRCANEWNFSFQWNVSHESPVRAFNVIRLSRVRRTVDLWKVRWTVLRLLTAIQRWDASLKSTKVRGNRKLFSFAVMTFKSSIGTDTAFSGWYTRRGCSTETKTCTGDDCVTCVEDNNCNKEVFPSSRHKCHKCNQANCANAKAEYCSIYLKNAKDCVTLFETGLIDISTNFPLKKLFRFC